MFDYANENEEQFRSEIRSTLYDLQEQVSNLCLVQKQTIERIVRSVMKEDFMDFFNDSMGCSEHAEAVDKLEKQTKELERRLRELESI